MHLLLISDADHDISLSVRDPSICTVTSTHVNGAPMSTLLLPPPVDDDAPRRQFRTALGAAGLLTVCATPTPTTGGPSRAQTGEPPGSRR